MTRTLLTGAAGFIGFHFGRRLLDRGHEVVGVDNLNPYYDVSLKRARLALLQGQPGFGFRCHDIADRAAVETMFREVRPEVVVHLAAQAGVRHSLENPHSYADSNLVGFLNVLEGCRHHGIRHLIFASSSSVYGANTAMPFSVHHNVDHPVSLYGATKKANELMAHSYSHLYALRTTGLRFFTVYGPWGRPDMAMFRFTRAILAGEPIDAYNEGRNQRDFTYIDDIVEGMLRVFDSPAAPAPSRTGDGEDPASSLAPYRIYNIGNNRSVSVLRLIELLELNLGRPAELRLLPEQPGDVPVTFADIEDLSRDFGFRPDTTLEEGVRRFVEWYTSYYRPDPAPVRSRG
jgi:UDP-glucuronate 4-epimerase